MMTSKDIPINNHTNQQLLKTFPLGNCHKRQRRKRQSVTAKREKSQTPKVLTAILTLPNLTFNLT